MYPAAAGGERAAKVTFMSFRTWAAEREGRGIDDPEFRMIVNPASAGFFIMAARDRAARGPRLRF